MLALQNIEDLAAVEKEVKRVLSSRGRFVIVLNHPAFRVLKRSSWGWDEEAGVQYRRVDGYLSAAKVPIEMHPCAGSTKTISYHRSLQDFFKSLAAAGFAVTKLEEWISHKASEHGPRQKAEDTARKEIPLFMLLEGAPARAFYKLITWLKTPVAASCRTSALSCSAFCIAIILIESNVLSEILDSTKDLVFVGSFIAGLFFTSIFTTAPAMVTLGEIAQGHSIILNAVIGALGAVLGDLIIFRFVKDRFSEHLTDLLATQGGGRRLRALLKRRSFRWITFLLGGLIIASPLPDELGVSLLGFSKMRASGFVILSFLGNFLGILLIGLAARAL